MAKDYYEGLCGKPCPEHPNCRCQRAPHNDNVHADVANGELFEWRDGVEMVPLAELAKCQQERDDARRYVAEIRRLLGIAMDHWEVGARYYSPWSTPGVVGPRSGKD